MDMLEEEAEGERTGCVLARLQDKTYLVQKRTTLVSGMRWVNYVPGMLNQSRRKAKAPPDETPSNEYEV